MIIFFIPHISLVTHVDNTPTYMRTNVQIQGIILPLIYTTIHLYQVLTSLFIAPNIFYCFGRKSNSSSVWPRGSWNKYRFVFNCPLCWKFRDLLFNNKQYKGADGHEWFKMIEKVVLKKIGKLFSDCIGVKEDNLVWVRSGWQLLIYYHFCLHNHLDAFMTSTVRSCHLYRNCKQWSFVKVSYSPMRDGPEDDMLCT